MTREERLDWLCRLRSGLVWFDVPPKERPVFEQVLSEVIKSLDKEPCEDAVSRQAVKETLRNRIGESISDCINALPSVTPTRKKGKWIGTCRIGFGEFADCEVELIGGFVADNCHCSECGEELEKGERGIYCPYCGADMRGEE